MVRDELLLQFLVDTGVLSREHAARSQEQAVEQGVSVVQVLRDGGAVSDTLLQRACAHVFGLPFVTFDTYSVPLETLREIPEAVARLHQVITLSSTPEALEVVTTQPYLSAEHIPTRGRMLKINLTDALSMRRALLSYQKLLREHLGNEITAQVQAIVPLRGKEEKELRYAAERVATARLVDKLLQHALHQDATVVELVSQERELAVRYRINGFLHTAFFLPLHVLESVTLRLRLLAGLPLLGGEAEGAFKMTRFEGVQSGGDVLVGASFYQTKETSRVTLRMTPIQGLQQGFGLESLGFHGKSLEDMYTALAGKGMLLVCGSERSGKSTLLYTLADMLMSPSQSVVCVDEHVQVQLPGVLHISLQSELGMRYDTAVRAALAHNPTVLCVADIPDSQTALLLLAAASRGIQVVAGIRAATALLGVEKLIQLTDAPELVAGVVRAVAATRLLRRLCPVHEVYKYTRTELTQLEEKVRFPAVLGVLKEEGSLPRDAAWKDVSFARATPCADCAGGYVGYVGAHEVLPVSLVVADALRRKEVMPVISALAQSEGMITLVEDCAVAAARGEISAEELLGLTLVDGV